MTEAAEREIRSLFESHQEYEQIKERLLADPIIQIALLIKQGNWQEAHHIAQAHEGNPEADYWHGIIHLIEGDDWNANYWFNRSKKLSQELQLKSTDYKNEESHVWMKLTRHAIQRIQSECKTSES